jgi:Ni/Co efflux regulator RcnB
MEIAIAIVILVVAVLVLGAAPMIRRAAGGREQEMGARLGSRGLDVDVNREFKRPRDEGDLF